MYSVDHNGIFILIGLPIGNRTDTDIFLPFSPVVSGF